MLLRRETRMWSVLWRRTKSGTPATVDSKENKVEAKKSSAVECLKECKLVPQKKPVYGPLNTVNVTVIGACHPKNFTLCSMLKLNPLVKELRMYDEASPLRGIAFDLGHINKPAKVIPFIGEHQLKRALDKAHIVVITASGEPKDVPNSAEVFKANRQRIKMLAQACIAYCPEAIFVMTAYPVNSTVPMFADMFLQNGVLCPNRVIGSLALEEMRARVLTAVSLGLDPGNVQVDVIGGGTPQTTIPVVSGTRPGGTYLKNEYPKIKKVMENMTKEILLYKRQSPTLSEGYAESLLVTNIIKGLCAKPHNSCSVFIRTSVLYGIKYLAVPVKFGLNGVYKNLGLPALSSYEIEALDAALPELHVDINRGEEYAQPRDLAKEKLYETEPDDCISIPSTLPRCSPFQV